MVTTTFAGGVSPFGLLKDVKPQEGVVQMIGTPAGVGRKLCQNSAAGRIRAYLAEHPMSSPHQVAEALNMPYMKAYTTLNEGVKNCTLEFMRRECALTHREMRHYQLSAEYLELYGGKVV